MENGAYDLIIIYKLFKNIKKKRTIIKERS